MYCVTQWATLQLPFSVFFLSFFYLVLLWKCLEGLPVQRMEVRGQRDGWDWMHDVKSTINKSLKNVLFL